MQTGLSLASPEHQSAQRSVLMAYFPLSSGPPSIPESLKLYHFNTVLEPANSTPSSKGKASPSHPKRETEAERAELRTFISISQLAQTWQTAEPWGRGQAVSDRQEQALCQAVMSLSAQAGEGRGRQKLGHHGGGGELGGETDRAERAAGR